MSDYHEIFESWGEVVKHDPDYPMGNRDNDESNNRPVNPDKWFSDEDTSGG